MALQVWLPLNADLHNQGLSKVNIINNGATINNNGKIGKCYSFNGSSYIDTGYIESFGTGDFTICCWIYLTQTSGKTYQCIIGNKGTGAASVGISLYYNQNQKKFLWSTADGSNATEIWSVDTFDTVIFNKWHHIAMVRNNNDTKKGYFYFDGIRKEIASVPVIRNVTSNVSLKVGSVTPVYAAYYYTGQINDIRIYDHALNDKEIEEISKGLVLHYQLNDTEIEPTINLCNGSTCGTQASSTSPSTWGGHKYYTILQNKTNNDPVPFSQKSIMTIDFSTSYGSSGGASVYPPTSFVVSPSTTYTYSKYIKPSDNFSYTTPNFLYRYEYASSGGSRLIEGGIFNKNNTEYIGNGWYRCWGTFTTQATTAYLTLPFYTYPGKSMTYELGGIQLEAKSHMTPYVSSNRTKNIIYDASGYNNNGTINDTSVTSVNISSKYLNCIKNSQANNSATYLAKGNINMPESSALTFSWWMNPSTIGLQTSGIFSTSASDLPTDYSTTAANMRDSCFDCCNTSGTCVRINVESYLTLNEWHHYALTYNGSKLIFYKDGIQKTTANQTGNLKSFTSIFPFYSKAGGLSRTTSGLLSDFRIYATALTPAQIKELYETSKIVDGTTVKARDLEVSA